MQDNSLLQHTLKGYILFNKPVCLINGFSAIYYCQSKIAKTVTEMKV